MLNFQMFIEWSFLGVISGAALYGVRVLSSLNASVNKLNVTVAKLLVMHAGHEREIDDIKRNIEKMRR